MGCGVSAVEADDKGRRTEKTELVEESTVQGATADSTPPQVDSHIGMNSASRSTPETVPISGVAHLLGAPQHKYSTDRCIDGDPTKLSRTGESSPRRGLQRNPTPCLPLGEDPLIPFLNHPPPARFQGKPARTAYLMPEGGGPFPSTFESNRNFPPGVTNTSSSTAPNALTTTIASAPPPIPRILLPPTPAAICWGDPTDISGGAENGDYAFSPRFRSPVKNRSRYVVGHYEDVCGPCVASPCSSPRSSTSRRSSIESGGSTGAVQNGDFSFKRK